MVTRWQLVSYIDRNTAVHDIIGTEWWLIVKSTEKTNSVQDVTETKLSRIQKDK